MYPKLVRDRIPEIIERQGKIVLSDIAHDRQVFGLLVDKVIEELEEYRTARSDEEFIDILEAFEALTKHHSERRKTTFEKLLRIKEKKRQEKGGFENMIVLKGIRSPRKKRGKKSSKK